MEQLAGGATLRDAGTTAGIATDKLLALLGEAGGGVPVQVNLQVNAALLNQRYQELVAEIERGTPALPDSSAAPPNSEPPAAVDLQSGKELPKGEQVSPST